MFTTFYSQEDLIEKKIIIHGIITYRNGELSVNEKLLAMIFSDPFIVDTITKLKSFGYSDAKPVITGLLTRPENSMYDELHLASHLYPYYFKLTDDIIIRKNKPSHEKYFTFFINPPTFDFSGLGECQKYFNNFRFKPTDFNENAPNRIGKLTKTKVDNWVYHLDKWYSSNNDKKNEIQSFIIEKINELKKLGDLNLLDGRHYKKVTVTHKGYEFSGLLYPDSARLYEEKIICLDNTLTKFKEIVSQS